MSTSRLSRCATESKSRRDLIERIQQEIHCRVSGVVAEPETVGDRDPLGHPTGRGRACCPAPAPLRHQREQRPLGRAALDPTTRGDPAQRRADTEPVPQLIQPPRPAEAPRVQRLDRAGVAAAIACPGSKNREIEATSRASASRSTVSARPKLGSPPPRAPR